VPDAPRPPNGPLAAPGRGLAASLRAVGRHPG